MHVGECLPILMQGGECLPGSSRACPALLAAARWLSTPAHSVCIGRCGRVLPGRRAGVGTSSATLLLWRTLLVGACWSGIRRTALLGGLAWRRTLAGWGGARCAG